MVRGKCVRLERAGPLLGAASVGAGFAPGNPVWLRVTGIILLIPTPLFVYSAVRMWRRCILCISPSALTVRLAAPKAEFIKIPRECVPSIVPKIPNGAGSRSCQVEISYRAADSNSDHAVLLGPSSASSRLTSSTPSRPGKMPPTITRASC